MYARCDERREGESDPLAAFCKVASGRLEQLYRSVKPLDPGTTRAPPPPLRVRLLPQAGPPNAKKAYLKLHPQIIAFKQVHHPRHPPLLLRHLPNIHRLPSALTTDITLLLILYQYLTQPQHPRDIFGRFYLGIVLEHRRDDRLPDGQAGGVWLYGEQRCVGGDGKQGEDGDVGCDGREEEGEEGRGGGL